MLLNHDGAGSPMVIKLENSTFQRSKDGSWSTGRNFLPSSDSWVTTSPIILMGSRRLTVKSDLHKLLSQY
jgi:hypothetical protein